MAATDVVELRAVVLDRLAAAVGFDGAFFATVDPATLLYTSGLRREIPADASPAFIRAEFAIDDINQLRDLAVARSPVGWLDAATAGDRSTSARYRDAMQPFGYGDELRVALRVDGSCWGLLCLHRAASSGGFTQRDADLLARLAPHLGEAIRRTTVLAKARLDATVEGPGVAVVTSDGTVEAATPAASRWLAELAEADQPKTSGLPTVVRSVVARLHAMRSSGFPDSVLPRAHLRSRSGRWLVIHASELDSAERGRVAVVIEPAAPAALAPMVVAAYGLTPRETEVVRALLAGHARKAIAAELAISLHTVNDHVKSIFEKTDVSSVGQLRAHVFAEHFAPR